MVITYHGDNYFKIVSGELVVLVDPTNQRSFKGATLVLETGQPPGAEPESQDAPLILSHQGEYEIQNIHIRGFTAEGTTIFRLEMDDMIIVVLGHLSKEPSPEIQEFLQEADIMIVPAGGKPNLSQENAAKLIRQLEPALVIPSLYQNLKPFLKETEQEKCEPEEKLVIKKKDLKPGAMTLRCLKF